MRNRLRIVFWSITSIPLVIGVLNCQALTKPDYPVIFIHGITGSADETWGDFRSFLVAEGWQFGGSPAYSTASKQVSSVSAADFYTMNMSDYNTLPFKSQNLTLSEQGSELAAVIAKVLGMNPGKTKVMLVAHSMGGLAARSYLQRLAKKDGVSAPYRGDVSKLITVCTPHKGAEIAVVVRESTAAGILVREKLNLRSDSVALVELSPNSAALLLLNDLTRNPLPSVLPYVSIVGTGLKQLLFPEQLGDGIVTASSQNMANVAGVAGLDHATKEMFTQPRSDCDPLFDLNAPSRALLKLDPLDKGVLGHTCATTDAGVRSELIRQLRPTSVVGGNDPESALPSNQVGQWPGAKRGDAKAKAVAVSGNYAYLADGDAGLQVIDVSNPVAPRRVSGFDTSGSASGVTVSGSYAYVADEDAGLQMIDVSNPLAPRWVGGFDTSGYSYDVAVSGKYAYVADATWGLQVIDVSNPVTPKRVGRYYDSLISGSALGVALSGNYAYVADGVAGLQVIDVTNPVVPKWLSRVRSIGTAFSVAVSGKYAYVAYGEAGLSVIDVSNPVAPRWVGGIMTSGSANGVAVSGNYAYVADWSAEVEVFDVSNAFAPRRVGAIDTKDAWDVAVAGDYVYVADGSWGLLVQPPTPPSIVRQPVNYTALEGGIATFSVSAKTLRPLRYQWRLNGSNLFGKTNDTLTLSGVRTNDAGVYSTVVSNEFGTVTSGDGWLTVVVPPNNARVLNGNSTTLTVSVASPGPVSYQWQKDGSSISGATNASFTIVVVQTKQAGTYTVLVRPSAGPSIPVSATLSIVSALRRLPSGFWPGVPIIVEIASAPTPGTISHTVVERLSRDFIPSLVPAYHNADGVPIAYRQASNFGLPRFVQLEAKNLNEDGVFDANTGTVKWGPFFDDSPRVLRYVIAPPLGTEKSITFNGTLSEDGRSTTLPDSIAGLYPLHPADNSPPADNFITLFELSAYAAAWRRSLLSPVPPNPIRDDYLTQAGLIWKRGEFYQTVVGTPPLNWQPAPLPPGIKKASLAADSSDGIVKKSLASASAASGTAVRSVSSAQVSPLGPFDVTITVTPQPSVMVLVLEEQLPPGWTATNINSGGLIDPNFNKVKWGPFFLNQSSTARTYTYRGAPPVGARGSFAFSGQAAFDGTVLRIGGQSEVSLGATETPRPQLRAELSDRNIILSWPKNASAFVLEVSENLTAASWIRVSFTPVVVGEIYTVKAPLADGSKFYRLRGQ